MAGVGVRRRDECVAERATVLTVSRLELDKRAWMNVSGRRSGTIRSIRLYRGFRFSTGRSGRDIVPSFVIHEFYGRPAQWRD